MVDLSDDPPYMEFDKFMLRSYSAKEVEKLSVLRIYQTKTFDALGFPIEGGLYDPALGPGADAKFEKCKTCRLSGQYCPGHLGHICLEVPVFNPVFFPFMFNLMKGTCVNCHRFMCKTDGPQTKLLLAQLRCIELGLTSRAEALGSILRETYSSFENKQDADTALAELADFNIEDIDASIEKMMGKDIATLEKNKGTSKNSIDFRRTLLKNFMKSNLFRHRVKCPLCKRRNGTFRNDGHRAILLDFGSGGIFGKKSVGKQKVKKEIEFDDQPALDDTGPIEEALDKAYSTKAYDADFLRSSNVLARQLEAIQNGSCTKLIWRGAEAREHFRLVWKTDGAVLKKLFPLFNFDSTKDNTSCPMDILFYELLVVPANKYRPIRHFKGDNYEDPQTVALRRILETNQLIMYAKNSINTTNQKLANEDMRTHLEAKLGDGTMIEKLHRAYLDLQLKVNCLYDSELNKLDRRPIPGIRQILEKKQGLFRMNMMGKRVNYACRSVITPDPYLDVDEIGIPEIFAKKLTFIETPNGYNEAKLRELIMNGPDKYPGANFIESNGRKTALMGSDEYIDERKAKARLFTKPEHSVDPDTGELKKDKHMSVYRHLNRGEMVLMNRQPSLHKPSIMGHRVRILKSQRALRMNYAPCKAYNADFDGDEMNGHYIQNRIGQVEASELANVGSNYLVPKDGTPILGLIQDHVVAGVLLTVRDTFLEKKDVMQLLLASFAQTTQRLILPPPAINYPRQLWTGKQVITAIIHNCLPENASFINLVGKAKTSVNCWKVDGYPPPKFEMSESQVIFHRGALVNGVMDKAHYGATQYGLIHCCFELYGHKVATRIMSCFSRCFTTYLQHHGFSLGVADILVKEPANKRREEIIKELRKQGDNIVKKTFGLPEDATRLQMKHALAKAYNTTKGEKTDVKMYEYNVKQAIAKFNDKINEACVPDGLIRRFPQNSLQLMIQSGAKGSAVNAIQISCALGQIELEGQRPGVSSAGRTLPSFWAFDPTPRAGGFVDQRFLTGINPQELFFHTMAGREGLIDTAVKTSRSGYLQRCIIKHLEGITVQYDGTVRDHDGSVIQFRYGEDGFDVGKATFLNPKQFSFLMQNIDAVIASSVPSNVNPEMFKINEAKKLYRKVRRRRRKFKEFSDQNPFGGRVFSSGFVEFSSHYKDTPKSEIQNLWHDILSGVERDMWEAQAVRHSPDTIDTLFNNQYGTLGALAEKTLDQIEDYYKSLSVIDERFRLALFWKGLRALVEPGENVGLLAAQSIGEPSTQMTLNTFHFAGRGEMNVTLGIPRLREILMTSGKNIATPTAEINIKSHATDADVERLKQIFNRVYLKKCLKKYTVKEMVNVRGTGANRIYEIALEILPKNERESVATHLTRKRILRQVEASFIKNVSKIIQAKLLASKEYTAIVRKKAAHFSIRSSGDNNDDDEEGGSGQRPDDDGMSSDEEVIQGAEDAGEARLHNRHRDDAAEYEGEEAEEEEVQEPNLITAESFTAYEEDSEAGEDEDMEEEEDKENENDETKDKSHIPIARIQAVKESSPLVRNYQFDEKSNRWCIFTLELTLDLYKVDINSIVDDVIDKYIIHETDKIEKCVIREDNKDDKNARILQTQGINLEAFYKNSDLLDVNTIYSNDITLMRSTYGVEACHRSIVREMNNVFGVYGIEVNHRHLTLLADYMTYTGDIAPFSRAAMASSSSPLQKMTFETTMNFMRDTLILGDTDYLNSPSSRIVTGQLIKGGTGAFELLAEPEYVLGLAKFEQPQIVIKPTEERYTRLKINFTDESDLD